jgi:excisionase family DNA binding protein
MEPMTYTVEEVAALMRIARNSAYEGVRSGEIPSIRVGRRYLIPRERFHTWLNSERVSAKQGVA